MAICCEHIIDWQVWLVWSNCVVNLFGSVGIFVDGVEYFSKRVVNDVIKLEVSTGVGIFF